MFMPACAYNGNRFKIMKMNYPPRYRHEHYGTDNEPLIGNIPSMGKDGKGEIEVTSADMAVPCVGLYYKNKKQGIFIMTPQQVKNGNIGYTVSEGKVKLSYPANRKNPYYAFKYDWYNIIDEKGIQTKERAIQALDFSETVAKYCSSWVVSYNHKFPEGSEFDRLGINAVGSVFASVQNAHSAPGICTLSGDCIYKLYKFTGNKMYLDLIRDIAYFIPQCMSTVERPIYARMGEPEGVSRPLPEGWICERVNTSDWERCYNGVGNVFYSNCWCSNSLLKSFAELMDYPEFKY